MNKSETKAQMNDCLRKALREYHASSGISQEKLAEKLGISTRACSALENGNYGFSAFSVLVLLSLLPTTQRMSLLAELIEIVLRTDRKAA